MSVRGFDDEYLSFFCSEFADILKAGMSSSEGFLLISEKETDQSAKAVLEELYRATDNGEGTAASMKQTGAFPEYMLKMVEIGELTGYLEAVFRSLSSYFDRQISIRRTIRSAVGYPALLFVIMLAVFFIFVCEVLPIFNDVFTQLGTTMSPAALAFMRFGLGVARARYVLLAVLAVLILICIAVAVIPSLKKRFTALKNKLSLRTVIGVKTSAARFASSLSLAYSGLADMDKALELAGRFCSDPSRVGAVDRARDRINSGEPIADSLAAESVFNTMYCRMIGIGIRAGTLDNSLSELSRRCSEELDSAIDRFTSRVEPITVIVLTVFVGLLLLSVMLPLVGVMSSL